MNGVVVDDVAPEYVAVLFNNGLAFKNNQVFIARPGDVQGLGIGRAFAFLAGLPLFFGGLGSLFAGTISNWLEQRTQGAARARRLLAGTGFAGAALCFTLSVHIHNPFWAMIALGVASFSNDLVMPPSWGACMDVGGRLCGTLSGAMNMMGGFVAALAPMVVALILTWSDDNWALTFYVSAAIYLLGTFLWLLLDPVTPIHPPKPQPPSP